MERGPFFVRLVVFTLLLQAQKKRQPPVPDVLTAGTKKTCPGHAVLHRSNKMPGQRTFRGHEAMPPLNQKCKPQRACQLATRKDGPSPFPQLPVQTNSLLLALDAKHLSGSTVSNTSPVIFFLNQNFFTGQVRTLCDMGQTLPGDGLLGSPSGASSFDQKAAATSPAASRCGSPRPKNRHADQE